MDLFEYCKNLARTMGLSFTLRRRALTEDEVFSSTGMFPNIAERANKSCVSCFGYGIGVHFVPEERSMLGKKVEVDEKAPLLIALHFITDVLIELSVKNASDGVVELEELLMD